MIRALAAALALFIAAAAMTLGGCGYCSRESADQGRCVYTPGGP